MVLQMNFVDLSPDGPRRQEDRKSSHQIFFGGNSFTAGFLPCSSHRTSVQPPVSLSGPAGMSSFSKSRLGSIGNGYNIWNHTLVHQDASEQEAATAGKKKKKKKKKLPLLQKVDDTHALVGQEQGKIYK
ncbi:hypothetical protein NC653_036820 [Populus alba x Populus x berolinensis]|uniref:Uncharacterized protein n=1 Tax=Populus alba x Populus x berolinensis TaxID=444605 RepID=A0AAD6PVB0_9ROSI|nr:hypothetical protein NC653_036820 [Populus alba x Populus x berolinensis]